MPGDPARWIEIHLLQIAIDAKQHGTDLGAARVIR